jgi:mannose-6-phosphate isomerase-like protein (cupin superfamily)
VAKAGQVIENGRGHRIVFIRTSADTNGELLELEEFLKPGGLGPSEHIHLKQTERFEVISGTMTAKIGDREDFVQAGGQAFIPAGTPHRWWNASQVELRLRTQLRPALHGELLFEMGFAALAKTGGVGLKPEDRAAALKEYPWMVEEYRAVGPRIT